MAGQSKSTLSLLKTKRKKKKKDNNELARIKYTSCTLSREPLRKPIMGDHLGNLFNKEALFKAILEKRIPKDLAHITGLKDVFEVNAKENPNFKAQKEKAKNSNFLIDDLSQDVPFVCPLTEAQILLRRLLLLQTIALFVEKTLISKILFH